MIKKTMSAVLLLLFTADASADGASSRQECSEPPVAVTSVRIFDGEAVIPAATVIFQCTKITRVIETGEVPKLPANATIINGEGKTLMPGLIDAHVHTFQRAMLERSLDFGVTTVFDMGSTSKTFVKSIREEDRTGPSTDRADMLSAVLWVTAPESHGTQWAEVPTLVDPQDASAFVAQRAADGADFIKIIYDNFKMFPGEKIPTLSRETMFAAVNAAHEQGMIAVVHSRDVDAYADVVEAGADGFVHLMVDETPSHELIQRIKSEEIFVSPNLSLARPDGLRLIDDPDIGPMLSDKEQENLSKFFGKHLEGGDQVEYDSLMAFHQAGVTILAGSDTPNGGTTVGASIHLELELLVEAGMSPIEALRAATSSPAKAFGLEDRGRIADGMNADLLLVDGKPDQNIKDTRKLDIIWKAGSRHAMDSRTPEQESR